MKIHFQPIGFVHSPFRDVDEMPIQPSSAISAEGYAEIFSQYRAGLKDLNGFSHVLLLYYLHKVSRVDLTVTPFLDDEPRGIFSTRAPTRPNPIGISVVRLIKVASSRIYLSNIDILDNTPLLDIKPYVPDFDHPSDVQIDIGWLSSSRDKIKGKMSDQRFK